MRILDLFSGTGSATKAFEDAGHEVIKIEIDEKYEAHERNVLDMTSNYLIDKYGEFDFVWASPPCQKFSIASVWKYWDGDRRTQNKTPKSEEVLEAIRLVEFTINLIRKLNPKAWLIENPRGMLRKQEVMLQLPRITVTYCQYGDTRMKPTDLWGVVENWEPKPMCKNGDSCHTSSPRGTNLGTARTRSPEKRSLIPYGLGLEIMKTLEKNKEGKNELEK